MKYKTISLIASLFFAVLLTPYVGLTQETNRHPEVAQDIRNVAALQKLESEPNSIAIYVKGLCCPVCSIGVRRKLSRLKGVDKSRFKSGVDLDAKHQIVTVAIEGEQIPDITDLAQAVDDAGYIAIHLYTIVKSNLKTTNFPIKD